jgi:cell division protein FtsL
MRQGASRLAFFPRVQSASTPTGREKARWIRESWPILLTTGIILAGSLLYVWQHIQVIRMGYRVERLNAELSTLIQEEKQLTLKLAQLKSLGRIEEIARGRLKMGNPEPSQIILHLPGETEGSKLLGTGR